MVHPFHILDESGYGDEVEHNQLPLRLHVELSARMNRGLKVVAECLEVLSVVIDRNELYSC